MRKSLHNPLEDFCESTEKVNEDKIKEKEKKVVNNSEFIDFEIQYRV